MKTDYFLHDLAYRQKHMSSAYLGWSTVEGLGEDLRLTWHPLRQRDAFPKQGTLLEVGCGAGNISIDFAQAGYRVTGVDISSIAIEWAMENAANAEVAVQFIQEDVLTLAALKDESFDIVLDGRCFHCIIGADRLSFLQAIHRVLKDGGTLALCSMCNQVPDTDHYREYFDPSSRCLFYTDHETAIRYIGDSNQIIQEVISAGFRIVDGRLIPPRQSEDLADLQLICQKV